MRQHPSGGCVGSQQPLLFLRSHSFGPIALSILSHPAHHQLQRICLPLSVFLVLVPTYLRILSVSENVRLLEEEAWSGGARALDNEWPLQK